MGLRIKGEREEKQTTGADLRPGDVFVYTEPGYTRVVRMLFSGGRIFALNGEPAHEGTLDKVEHVAVRILPPGTLLEVE